MSKSKEIKEPKDALIESINEKISLIEKDVKKAIMNEHEDINGLILRANSLVVDINDKSSYDSAIELKREVKTTHVSIKKKTDLYKKPMTSLNKRIESFKNIVYEPLVLAEKKIVEKVKPFELHQEKLKQEALNKQLIEENSKKELEEKLSNLNSTLGKINLCKTKGEISEIEEYLNGIDSDSFGERSDEAAFIVNNLLLACKMFKQSLPEKLDDLVASNNEDLNSNLSEEKQTNQNLIEGDLKSNFDVEEVDEIKTNIQTTPPSKLTTSKIPLNTNFSLNEETINKSNIDSEKPSLEISDSNIHSETKVEEKDIVSKDSKETTKLVFEVEQADIIEVSKSEDAGVEENDNVDSKEDSSSLTHSEVVEDNNYFIGNNNDEIDPFGTVSDDDSGNSFEKEVENNLSENNLNISNNIQLENDDCVKVVEKLEDQSNSQDFNTPTSVSISKTTNISLESDEIDIFGTLVQEINEQEYGHENIENNVESDVIFDNLLENNTYMAEITFDKVNKVPLSINLTNKESGEVISFFKNH